MKEEEPEAKSSTLDRLIKLVIEARLLLLVLGTLATAVWANFSASSGATQADKAVLATNASYSVLVTKVNQLAEDVAYLKGRLDGNQARRHERHVGGHLATPSVALALAAPEADTDDEEPADSPLPASLEALMQTMAPGN